MIRKKRTFIVSDKYAKELRERLKRYRTGNFNEEDKCMIERSKKIFNKYINIKLFGKIKN